LIACSVFCLQEDLYYPHPWIQDVLWGTLHKVVEPVLSKWPGSLFRKKALAHTMEHIHYEDENSRYIDIGPVNKVSIHMSFLADFPS
jgi:cycloartenol synthase